MNGSMESIRVNTNSSVETHWRCCFISVFLSFHFTGFSFSVLFLGLLDLGNSSFTEALARPSMLLEVESLAPRHRIAQHSTALHRIVIVIVLRFGILATGHGKKKNAARCGLRRVDLASGEIRKLRYNMPLFFFLFVQCCAVICI